MKEIFGEDFYLECAPGDSDEQILVNQTLLGIALVGALIELVCEIFFSPVGYKICKRWQSEGVGNDYFKYCEEMELKKDPSRFNFN